MPTAGNDVVKVATPLVRVALPMAVEPLMKVTVPVGTPPAPVTVAVKVALPPGATESAEAVKTVELGVSAAVTTSDNVAVAVAGGFSGSATCTVKVEVPTAVGVPVIAPVAGASVNPGGRLPEVMLQV